MKDGKRCRATPNEAAQKVDKKNPEMSTQENRDNERLGRRSTSTLHLFSRLGFQNE